MTVRKHYNFLTILFVEMIYSTNLYLGLGSLKKIWRHIYNFSPTHYLFRAYVTHAKLKVTGQVCVSFSHTSSSLNVVLSTKT